MVDIRRIEGNIWNNTIREVDNHDKAYIIWGFNGRDKLHGHLHNDTIFGGRGKDKIWGWDGNDYLKGDGNEDKIWGGNGSDNIFGGTANDTLWGENGTDYLFGDNQNDLIYGGNGDDLLSGGNDHDVLHGEDGNDVLLGDDGEDRLGGGNGDDLLKGGSGIDFLWGGAGNDILRGGNGERGHADYYHGGYGADTIRLSPVYYVGTAPKIGEVNKNKPGAAQKVQTKNVVRYENAAELDGDVIYGFTPGETVIQFRKGAFSLHNIRIEDDNLEHGYPTTYLKVDANNDGIAETTATFYGIEPSQLSFSDFEFV